MGGTNPGGHNANIAKMSISAVDPIHHPPDSVYLYCIWTQFDSGDTSDAGYGNGDIYGAGSRDGGATWGPSYNLTNTKTPGCVVGDCLSEHWSSMAQNMHNGALHIQYVCDKHPGFAMIGGDWESQWADNPIMYLELEAWVLGTWLERGDANADGTIDLGDAVYILNYLFKGGPPPNPPDSGDANCDGMVELGDAIYLLNYLFKGGPPPGCP